MTKQSVVLRCLSIIFFSLWLSFSLVACRTISADERNPENINKGPINVDDLVGRAETLKGYSVNVMGTYMGWKGDCLSGPPVSRSDWMLEFNETCIYVNGSVPQGIQRGPQSKDIGKTIFVRGVVKFDSHGIPYLKAVD